VLSPSAVVTLAALSLSVAACSTHGGGSTSAPPPGVAPGTEFALSFGPITAQPGEEHTKCVVLRLGNPLPIHVGTIHNVLSTGSHHMIVYKSSETVPQPTPTDCVPFTDTLDPSKGSTLMVTQKHDDTLTLPSGVAFALDANQMVRMEVHYINPTQATEDITATASFVTMDESTFKDEAGFLFIGDPDITLPPNASATLGPINFILPQIYDGVSFFAITGHEHRFGTNVTVSTIANATDPGAPVYDVPGWLWSEPKTVMQDPPFTIPHGGGFRFQCDWNNTSSSTVRFGESATDEMCFFWAYYYPTQGSKVCMHTDQVTGGLDLCCPGKSFLCTIIQQQIDSDGGLGRMHDAGDGGDGGGG
jgi:hypothetical protein